MHLPLACAASQRVPAFGRVCNAGPDTHARGILLRPQVTSHDAWAGDEDPECGAYVAMLEAPRLVALTLDGVRLFGDASPGDDDAIAACVWQRLEELRRVVLRRMRGPLHVAWVARACTVDASPLLRTVHAVGCTWAVRAGCAADLAAVGQFSVREYSVV